jgi:hypothetical protein
VGMAKAHVRMGGIRSVVERLVRGRFNPGMAECLGGENIL